MSVVPKASAVKFLSPFGNPTNTALLTQTQTPPYPDKGVMYAGYAKQQNASGYVLKRQNERNYSIISQSAVDVLTPRPNYQTHDFCVTDVLIEYSRVPGNLGTPRAIQFGDGVVTLTTEKFRYYIAYSSWENAADLADNWTALAEKGTPINVIENGIMLHFSVPIIFSAQNIFMTASGATNFFIHVALFGFDEEK